MLDIRSYRFASKKTSLHYAFLEKLFRELAEPLDFSDIRRLSSVLSTLSNEKQRAEKDKKAGGKKPNKKAQVKVASFDDPAATASSIDYNNDAEYDDFMWSILLLCGNGWFRAGMIAMREWLVQGWKWGVEGVDWNWRKEKQGQIGDDKSDMRNSSFQFECHPQ